MSFDSVFMLYVFKYFKKLLVQSSGLLYMFTLNMMQNFIPSSQSFVCFCMFLNTILTYFQWSAFLLLSEKMSEDHDIP